MSSAQNVIASEDEIQQIITGYEKQYRMSSQKFLQLWKSGKLPDVSDMNSWAILLDALAHASLNKE